MKISTISQAADSTTLALLGSLERGIALQLARHFETWQTSDMHVSHPDSVLSASSRSLTLVMMIGII